MNLIPISIAGALVAGTVALARTVDVDPGLAGLATGGMALVLITLGLGLALALSPRGQRMKSMREIWDVVRKDLADLRDTLAFRR